ncbi:hypothetical protein DIPPA_10973 [Diplonema papillatum]|nr:hypothetical protein DIPPA_10973 [Diplonema papillatum]
MNTAYNAPFVGKFGEYNSWKHDKDLHTISPFLEDRIRGQKKHDDHGHHGH